MTANNQDRRHAFRRGHTLVELMASMAAAAVLMAGLTSSIYIASQAFDGTPAAVLRSRAAEVQADMLIDLSLATSFSVRNSDSVTFTVPDVTGDSLEETISYTWLSGPNQLELSCNGTTTTLLEDVTGFQLGYGSRFLEGRSPPPPPFDPNVWGNRWPVPPAVVFEEFEDEKENKSISSLDIKKPDDTATGALLIAAVATSGNNKTSLAAPAGWNLITVEKCSDHVTLGVWWKIAGSSEPSEYQFTWEDREQAYGWIMRFSDHDPRNPINAWTVQTTEAGETLTPTSPSVVTNVDRAMILRLGGFGGSEIIEDNPGLPDHTPVTMDRSDDNEDSCSGGAGYVLLPAYGSSGESTFTLTGMLDTVAITVAIAPDPNN